MDDRVYCVGKATVDEPRNLSGRSRRGNAAGWRSFEEEGWSSEKVRTADA